jgi:hypothetical protein
MARYKSYNYAQMKMVAVSYELPLLCAFVLFQRAAQQRCRNDSLAFPARKRGRRSQFSIAETSSLD